MFFSFVPHKNLLKFSFHSPTMNIPYGTGCTESRITWKAAVAAMVQDRPAGVMPGEHDRHRPILF